MAIPESTSEMKKPAQGGPETKKPPEGGFIFCGRKKAHSCNATPEWQAAQGAWAGLRCCYCSSALCTGQDDFAKK